jgi:hypothetical protein
MRRRLRPVSPLRWIAMKQDQDHSQQQSTDRAGRIRGSHVLAGGVALAVLIAATIGVLSLRGGETEETYVFSSILVDPPEDAPALGLVTQHGDSFDADVLRGEVTLVYFGYTHCPGDDSALARVAEDWRIRVEYGPTLEDGSYFVGHPAFSLVLDRDMRKRLMVPSQMTATQLALDLAQLLEE